MQRVDAGQWLHAIDEARQQGFIHFVTLMAFDDDGVELRLRLRNGRGEDLVVATAIRSAIPTLIAQWPEASWPERAIAETFGISFAGHNSQPLFLPAGAEPTMRKARLLDARQSTPWPGEKDPGGTTPRRRTLPPGVAGGAR